MAKVTGSAGQTRAAGRAAEAGAPAGTRRGGNKSSVSGQGLIGGRSSKGQTASSSRTSATNLLGGGREIRGRTEEEKPKVPRARSGKSKETTGEVSPAAAARMVAERRPGMAKETAPSLLERKRKELTPGSTADRAPSLGRVSDKRAVKTGAPASDKPTLTAEWRNLADQIAKKKGR